MVRLKKYSIFFYACLLFFIVSCKKIDNAFRADLIEKKLPDNILYYDLVQDDSLQSVSYFYEKLVGGWNYCTVPFPDSNSCSKSIDFNNDSANDFKLLANHASVQISVSGCPTFKYSSRIECLNNSDSIITQSPGFGMNNPFPYPYMYGDTIKKSTSFNRTAWVHQYDFSKPVNSYLTPTYIGFKRTINYQNYYGWLLIKANSLIGIKVYEIAINTTPGNPIRAGQKN